MNQKDLVDSFEDGLIKVMKELVKSKKDLAKQSLQEQICCLEKENLILKKALDEIISPIKYMKQKLKYDEELNGYMACRLSDSSEYLKLIAERAMDEINKLNL